MSDETKPPAPDGGSAPREQDDALDSWFRPRAQKQERQQEQPAPAPEAPAEKAGTDEAEAPDAETGEAGAEAEVPEAGTEAAVDAEVKSEAEVEAEAESVAEAPEAPGAARSAENAENAGSAEPAEAAEPTEAAEPAEASEEPSAEADDQDDPPAPPDDLTQVMPVVVVEAAATQVIHREPSGGDGSTWRPQPAPQQAQQPTERIQQQPVPPRLDQTPPRPYQAQPFQQPTFQQPPFQQPGHQQTRPYEAPGGRASILPVRGYNDEYDDFDNYSYVAPEESRPRGRARRALLTTAGVAVLALAVVAALAFSGKVKVLGIGAKPVPTVGFSPSGSDAGSYATQTGSAFLTAWQNGDLKAAANITDNQSAALAALTAYKHDLKVSGLTLMPGTASAQGWMTFSVTAQVGSPSSAWSYSSGLAAYSADVDGYTRWFVKWQPNLLFTSLKSGQKLALGTIPPTADKVVDSSGAEITGANAPSLKGIVSALKKSAPPTDGTPGQEVQIRNADGSVAAKVVKVSDPVATSAVKTTIDLHVQAAAQAAVNQAPNSSMVVLQPSTGNILAVANNPANGLDTAMVGHYAPGSTFKTVTTALALNKGVITSLGQTWDCPKTLNADGITLHNSEQEEGVGKSFLWDFAQSCNNAFSRFGGKVSRTELASTAHDYFGFNQKWDVGLGEPTTYGNVPDTSANSLAEELVGQDQITASPLTMASVAATVADGSFKQPILVPGTKQVTGTPLPAATAQKLKTLMHEVVVSGTLADLFHGRSGLYAKTGTAEVQGKEPNSWTIAFQGDYAVAALAIGGGFGASTAGPQVKALLNAVQ